MGQATCERGFAAMEESHHKVVRDLQRQHRREISKLTEERERLLAEETAATVAGASALRTADRDANFPSVSRAFPPTPCVRSPF